MMVTALEGHRVWAESYDRAPNPVLALERRVLSQLLGAVEGRRAVDVACGTGHWAAYLATRGAHSWGVDYCAEMLMRAPGVLSGCLVLANAEDLPFADESADLVICGFALGYFADAGRALREMARIAAPGASVVLSDIHPEAIARGWTRSFRAASGRYEMEHFAHTSRGIYRHAEAAGLAMEAEHNLRFGEQERPIFEQAGKAARFAECTEVPAVWIGKWIKP